jgi:DNA-binding NarL/FixJ family response regulator
MQVVLGNIADGFRTWRHRKHRQSPKVLLVGEPAALGAAQPEGLEIAGTLEEALSRLDREDIPVVLCDREGPNDWTSAVRRLARTACRPSVILLSDGDTLSLFEQVAAAGGYDILRKPAAPGVLDHVIRAAAVYWRCRRTLDRARRK